MSLFITFEGGEGCGKSLQAKRLYKRLEFLDIPVLLTREPGGTPLGERISRWLKWSHPSITPLTELFLFNASRAQLVAEVIMPALKEGKVVICDRYTDSTIAYQSYGRGLDLEMVRTLNRDATQGLKPTLTFLLDIQAEDGLARKEDKKQDHFEQEKISFHRRVRQGYLKLALEEPERWLVIDATQSKDKVTQIIWEKVHKLITRNLNRE